MTKELAERDKLNPIPISTARTLANKHGATRLVILTVDDDGNYSWTTFGRTKSQCRALAEWANTHAVGILVEVFEA